MDGENKREEIITTVNYHQTVIPLLSNLKKNRCPK